MRGTRAVVVAIALIALVPGSGLAQERGSGSGASTDKKTSVKKTKPKTKKTAKTKKTSKVRKPVETGGAVAPPAGSSGDVEFTVKSSPRGATIEIDGVSHGAAPVRVRARPGRRVVSAKLSGYVDAATTLDIEEGLGYVVFSLASEPKAAKVADKRDEPAKPRGGFGTAKLSYSDAIQKARMSLKRNDYEAALRYAEAALASKSDDNEAGMIATIAACGVGDERSAKRHLPRPRGSYREISITRCGRLGVELP